MTGSQNQQAAEKVAEGGKQGVKDAMRWAQTSLHPVDRARVPQHKGSDSMTDTATGRLKRAAFEAERTRKQQRLLPHMRGPHDQDRSRYMPRADVPKADRRRRVQP